ncbi:MAG: DUF4142 domain-containing protein [Terriglobales bacterium]
MKFVLLLGLGLAVSAGAQQHPRGSNFLNPTVHQRAQLLLIRMHAYNQAQIRMGELVSQYGASAKVRRLGTLVARYHKFADEKLRQVAAKNSLALSGPLPSGRPAIIPAPPGPPLPPLAQSRGAQLDAEFLLRLIRQDETELHTWAQVEMFVRVARLSDMIHDMTPIVKQEQRLALSLRGTVA